MYTILTNLCVFTFRHSTSVQMASADRIELRTERKDLSSSELLEPTASSTVL